MSVRETRHNTRRTRIATERLQSVNAPGELIRLAELIERNVAAYTQADIAESLYYAGRVAAFRWCAAEARRAAAALGGADQARANPNCID